MSTTETNNTSDKANEPAKAKATQDKSRHAVRHPKKGPRHFLLPLLGLLFLAGIAGGVWLFQTMSRNNVQQQDAINDLRDKLRSSQQQAATQFDTLGKKLDRQHQAQEALRDNLTTLLKRNEHLRKDWLLGEAEYLLKLASYRLQLERDVTTALRAMHIADERLRDIGDPALLSVRKVLADDQNALKNVPAADITGMSLTLSALINNIDKLPLNTPMPETVQKQAAGSKAVEKFTNWKEVPRAIWQELKSLVTIRQHDTKIAALLSPKEDFYLLQNLRLQLEQARLALLLGKGNVFSERLQTAQKWLQRFFDLKDVAVQNTLQSLQQLATVNIEPEIPTIDKSYQALKSYMADNPATQSELKNDRPAPSPEKVPVVKQSPKVIEKKSIETPSSKPAPRNKVQL